MINITKPIKSIKINNSDFKYIKNVAFKRELSTTGPTLEDKKSTSNETNGSNSDFNTPPYGYGDHCRRGWGWGWNNGWHNGWYGENGWNKSNMYDYYRYRHYRKRGFFLFFIGFAGGIFAHKVYLRSDCAREREERRKLWENYTDSRISQPPTYNQQNSNSNILSNILNSLPIVNSLRTDPEYKETKILEGNIISPSTNSTFEDSVVLSVKPIEFINQSTSENVSVLSLPDISDRPFKNNFGWRKDKHERHGGFNNTLVMIIDEYMKQNASKVLNISESSVYTKSLNIDFKSWFNNYQNIVLKTSIDIEKSKELNNVVIIGTIMTTEGKVITKVNGVFTGDSSNAPKESKDVYSFRKWVWNE